ncbi:hypothetical protein EFK50_01390 [Nocardioides marmoriginsengisoli]|uniref:Uncharacterized protein n=1 Tax=Nocardioides marmoriginsengisoli TaxID=661483 RepID=A0A3N0CQR6_9ACTN|nr:hypothetical protein [Nocardioides marmoriginsengisoli]RNL65730.1 hypothetical protein EFK50_01390 [Nocardioides marmoriginsengisoli]
MIRDASAPVLEWLLVLSALGISIWMITVFVGWLWGVFQDMTTDFEAEARRAGYKNAAERDRDHW